MSRALGRLSFGDRSLNSWCVQEKARQEAAGTPAGEPEPAIVRIHHPVTKAPEYRCYRVVRHFRRDDCVEFEDIGAFKDPLPALRMLDAELGRARILDPNGRVYSDNLQTMETRA